MVLLVTNFIKFLIINNMNNILINTTQELEDNGYTLKQEEEEIEFRESTEAESKIIENPVLIINEDETQIRYKGNTYILSKYLWIKFTSYL